MSIIENLLFNITDNSETKTTVKKSGFLLDLVQSFKDEPEKITDLFKSLDIKEEDLDRLLDKFTKKEPDLKNLISKIKLSLKETKNTPVKNIENVKIPAEIKTEQEKTSDKQIQSLLAKLIQKPISNEKFESEVKKIENEIKKHSKNLSTETVDITHELQLNIPLEDSIIQTQTDYSSKTFEKKVVEVTTKIITSQHKLENTKLSEQDIKEFKNVNTLKELVELANKKELNISKIVISHYKNTKKEKPETAQKFKPIPKHKIEINANNIQQNKKSSPLQKILQPQINIQNVQTESKSKNTPAKKETLLNRLITKKTSKESFGTHDIKPQKNSIENEPVKETKPQPHNDKSGELSSFSVTELKHNITKAKQSIKHFAANLKEAVENYKPPVSKLSMELHPKELGKVEVTLVHRGDNLQIQINSNNTAVGFLHSQQQELKQNLINMGFTDVNMSFNSNQQQGNKEYRQNQKFKQNSEENEELIIEIPYQYA